MTTASTAAVLTKASGSVFIERNGTRFSLAEGDTIRATDTIITDSRSTAEIRFEDGATASLSPSSSLLVSEFAFGDGQDPSFVLNMTQGAMRSVSGGVVKQNPEAFKIITPKATMGIRGTELFTAVKPGGEEFHAVLQIGANHIVLITSHDGQQLTLDKALQAVTLPTGATMGTLTKQTFNLSDLRQAIQSIAPTQIEKPINPSGEEAGDQQPVEQVTTSDTPLTVLIVYENVAIETVKSLDPATNASETLITAVETLQGELLDAGFAVAVVETTISGTIVSALDLPFTPSPTLPGSMDPELPIVPPAPPAPPEPETPPSFVFVFDGDLPAGWGLEHLANLDPAQVLDILVKGDVLEHLPVNVQSMLNGATAGDVVNILGALRNANLMGDAEVLGQPSRARMAGTADIQTGDDTLSVGTVESTAAVYGDAREILGSATVQLGNDSITVGTLAGTIYGDVGSPLGTGAVTFGNDTIKVETMLAGSAVYGDARTAATGPADGGNDLIEITLMQGGTVDGGIGADTITIGTMQGGALVQSGGTDQVTVTSMTGGSIVLGAGTINVGTLDGAAAQITGTTVEVGTLQNGTILLNAAGTVTVNAMQGGAVTGSLGNDLIKVTGDMSGGTLSGGGGGDTLTLSGTMSGGLINDTGGLNLDLNALSSSAQVNLSSNGSHLLIRSNMSGGSVTISDMTDSSSLGWVDIGETSTASGVMAGGTIHGGTANDRITVNGIMTDGTINGGIGQDSITVNGVMAGGTINGGDGEDVIIVNGTMKDGTLDGGGGQDSITVNGSMSGGTIKGGGGLQATVTTLATGGYVELVGGSAYPGGASTRLTIREQMTGGTIQIKAPEPPYSDMTEIQIGTGAPGSNSMLGGEILGSTGVEQVTINGTMNNGSINLGGVSASGSTVDKVTVTHLTGSASITGECLAVIANTMSGGSVTLTGSDSLSSVTISEQFSDGTITGSSAANTFTVGTVGAEDVLVMSGGNLDGGGGDDTISIYGKIEGGAINGGAGNDSITIRGSMAGGVINGGAGENSITINGIMAGGAITGGGEADLITVNGTMTDGTLDGGGGDDMITVSGIMTGGLIKGGEGDDIILVNDTMTGGTLEGGTGADNLTVRTVNGEVVIDFGNDTVQDVFHMENFVNGTIHFNNFTQMDLAFLNVTGIGTYSQSGGVFTITYADGRTITFTGGLIGADADATWSILQNQLISPGTILAEPGEMSSTDFSTWVAGTAATTLDSALLVKGSLTPGDYALNGQNVTTGVTFGNSQLTIVGDLTPATSSFINIYGDVENATNNTGTDLTFGSDAIYINGIMGVGASIYGDADSITSTGKVTFGNDFIHVKTLNGGDIYGDAGVINAAQKEGGNDTIVIDVLEATPSSSTPQILAGPGADRIEINNLVKGDIRISLGNDTDADHIFLQGNTRIGSNEKVVVLLKEFHQQDKLDLGLSGPAAYTYSQDSSGGFTLKYTDLNLEVNIGSGSGSLQGTADETFAALIANGQLNNYGASA